MEAAEALAGSINTCMEFPVGGLHVLMSRAVFPLCMRVFCTRDVILSQG